MKFAFDLMEISICIIMLSVSFGILIASANITNEKQKKLKELANESGEIIEITIKYPCYLPEERIIISHKGTKFVCGNGKIERK
jgi:hypothetical protein